MSHRAGDLVNDDAKILIRTASVEDMQSIVQLVASCREVDLHTVYTYWVLLEYAGLGFVAERADGVLLGFISGVRSFKNPTTFFLWQIAVSDDARGLGVGSQLLTELGEAAISAGAERFEVTTTANNLPALSLLRKFADAHGLDVTHMGSVLGQLYDVPGEDLYLLAPSPSVISSSPFDIQISHGNQ